MFGSSTKSPSIEPADSHHHHHHLLCWKSVIAGLFITVMAFMGLSALGAGFLGSAASSAIENETSGSFLASGAGLWLGISAVMSLFLGSYFTARISKAVTNRVGAAHGFVLASIFFSFLMFEAGGVVGHISSGIGQIAKSIGASTTDIASNPVIQDTINQSIEGANLKIDPKEFAQGMASRLLQGNVTSAKIYFSFETGMSQADVDRNVAKLKASFDQKAKEIGDKAAAATADAGYSLALLFFVGLLASMFGGRVGAHANVDRPLVASDAVVTPSKPVATGVLANQRGNVLPYVVGWLLGVPLSVLFLIAILRSVF